MPKHIGIVGCSSEGAALCYQTICLESKKHMGEQPHTKYYVKYMLDKATGLEMNPEKVNVITTYSFFIILVLSTVLMIRNYSGLLYLN